MSREKQMIERTHQELGRPSTVSTLLAELRELGVEEGMTLIVHSAMSQLGWIAGGAEAVVEALQRAVGPSGTLVMPTHSNGLSDPSHWANPPAPESWWDAIRAETPPYDPNVTPTRQMGAVPETFRRLKGVRRSNHPHFSFAARGPRADEVLDGHGDDPDALGGALGESSPVGRVRALGGSILLLGVTYENNTTLHLAEYLSEYDGKPYEENRAPIRVAGEPRWAAYRDIAFDSDDFEALGAEFERETGLVRTGRVGLSTSRLMPSVALVDYAVRWMERHRGTSKREV
ncbi:AAC(3) family N-acetyltransferase [Paenibacillus sp. TRM 82003]|nr:AAC(3) family N-acetyltransferase [Paenibacillus sp. TRM 82003]